MVFATAQAREYVKATSINLAGKQASIRLHVPVHLKANFRHLDALCYALKQKHPSLKCSIKLDDDTMDLVADFKIGEGSWQRVFPSQARQARANDPSQVSNGPNIATNDSISSLLSIKPMATGS